MQPNRSLTDPTTIADVYQLSAALAADPRVQQVRSYAYFNPDWTLADYQRAFAAGFDALPEESRQLLARLVNLDSGADTALVFATLHADPESKEADSLVADVRSEIIPSIQGLEGAQVLVGGPTAVERDLRLELYNKFPVVVALVLAATFVLLTILFRSLVIPAKAVLMNLLSLFAAYGFLVLVFQHGYGDKLLGFTSAGYVNWITPVMLFCILFGLSMDYEVFLLSRIREFRDRGASTPDSVAMGLERTGGIITGAAVIMIVVFSAFALSPIIIVKEIGFSLAVAVLLDATIIRVLLVPSLMRVLGPANWWLPAPLKKILPPLSLEAEEEEPPPTPPPVAARAGGLAQHRLDEGQGLPRRLFAATEAELHVEGGVGVEVGHPRPDDDVGVGGGRPHLGHGVEQEGSAGQQARRPPFSRFCLSGARASPGWRPDAAARRAGAPTRPPDRRGQRR